jgi:hypothetical protein
MNNFEYGKTAAPNPYFQSFLDGLTAIKRTEEQKQSVRAPYGKNDGERIPGGIKQPTERERIN